MAEAESSVVDLRGDDARYIDDLVSSGAYRSPAEAVSASLSALREARFRAWVEVEVIPVYDRAKADPSSLIPANQVFAELRARHEARWGKNDK